MTCIAGLQPRLPFDALYLLDGCKQLRSGLTAAPFLLPDQRAELLT